MFKILGLVFLLFVAVVVISFSSLNAQSIQINYYFGTKDIPLALAMVVSIAVGILFGFFASFGAIMRLKRENMRLKRTAKSTDRQLTQLRSTPIQES